MVFSIEGGEYMGRERAKTRHNFILPELKWGIQRSLRCMKVQSNDASPSQLDNRNRSAEKGGEEGTEEKIISDRVVVEEEEKRPWNLRKRRAACKAPPPVTESGSCDAAKFLSTLSKKEMEDDYMAMMGHRPPRRPKKRLRTLQKQIDLLHPALYFTQITEDIYQVPDDNGKR